MIKRETVQTLASSGTNGQKPQLNSPLETVKLAFERRNHEVTTKEGKYHSKDRDGNEYTVIYHNTNCPGPNHGADGDKKPSLYFWEVEDDYGKTTVAFNCLSGHCSRYDILKALGINDKVVPGAPTTNYKKKPVITLEDFANYTKLDWLFLTRLGWHEGVAPYHRNDGSVYKERGVIIPFYYANEKPFDRSKIRLVCHKQAYEDAITYKWTEGDDHHMLAYGWHRLQMALDAGYLVMVEGETDVATLWFHNIPALGIPGGTMAGRTIITELLMNIPRIYIIQERTDQTGIEFPFSIQRKLLADGYQGEILRVPLLTVAGVKDPNDLHKKLYAQMKAEQSRSPFTDLFQQCLDQAKPLNYDTGEAAAAEVRAIEGTAVNTSEIEKAIAAKDARAIFKLSPTLARLSKQEYALLKLDLKATFDKNINLNDLDASVNEARKELEQTAVAAVSSPTGRIDLDHIAHVFAEKYGDNWAYDTNSQSWREFGGTHWAECFTPESERLSLDNLFTDLMHDLDLDVNSNSTLDCIHRRTRGLCKRDFITKSTLINFRNGTLEIDMRKHLVLKLRGHNREDNITYCLDYDYVAGSFPVIQQFMDDSLPDLQAQQAYMATIGLALLGDTSMQYYLFLYGKPNAGKSTYLRLGNAACGHIESNCSSFTGDVLFSDELEGARERYLYYQRRMVCADELRPETFREHENIIKTMTAHMGIPIRGIQKNGQKDNQWTPKIMMTANELPHYKDTAGGLKRRTLYLYFPFSKTEEDQDPTLFGQLLDELGPFAFACIQLGLAVLKRRYYPKSVQMKKTSHDASISGNTLKTFVEDECILLKDHPTDNKEDYQIFSSVLHARYKDFCLENENKPGSTATMTTALKEMNIGVTSSDTVQRLKGHPKPGRVLFGIRLREDYDPIDEDQARKSLNIADIPLAPSNEFVTSDDENVTMGLSDRYNSQNGSTSHLIPVSDNEVVTMGLSDRYNSQNGSTSHVTVPKNSICNDVTTFSCKDAPTRDTLPCIDREDDTRGKGVSMENLKRQNVVTSLQNGSNEPLTLGVEPNEFCNDDSRGSLHLVTSPLQNHMASLQNGIWVTTPAGTGQIVAMNSMSVDVDCMGRRVHYTGSQILQITAR